jgi:hypothetical protein
LANPYGRSGVDLAPSTVADPSSPGRRVEALAARLAGGRPATAVLRAWCEAHSLGAGPIRARKRRPVTVPARDARATEHLGRDGDLALRRVALCRGRLPLSFAELRWRPDRLPADCRRALATTDRPFGEVIAPLAPERRTLAMIRPASRRAVLVVEAVVLVDARPVAVVHERYLASLIPA